MKINCTNCQTKDIVKLIRESSNKSQKSFAEDINKTREWCAAIENGKANILLKDLVEIAKINGVKITITKEK